MSHLLSARDVRVKLIRQANARGSQQDSIVPRDGSSNQIILVAKTRIEEAIAFCSLLSAKYVKVERRLRLLSDQDAHRICQLKSNLVRAVSVGYIHGTQKHVPISMSSTGTQ